jgi:hypothetical protein
MEANQENSSKYFFITVINELLKLRRKSDYAGIIISFYASMARNESK